MFAKLPDGFLDHVEEAVNYAKSIGLLVYPALMSFDWGKGNHLHPEIINDTEARQSWIDNAITPLVERLKSNSGVFAWDLWNEPEWIVASTDGGEPGNGCSSFKLADIKALMNGILSMMRAKGVKQPVSMGSASLKFMTQKKLWNDLDLDFWDFHWYSWATPYFNPLLSNASEVISPSKPVIIGEIMADPSQDSVLASAANTWCNGQICTDHGRLITKLAKLGYSGYMPWSWTDSSSLAESYIGSHFTEFASVCPVGSVSSSSGATQMTSASIPVPTSPSSDPIAVGSSDEDTIKASAQEVAVGISCAVVTMVYALSH
eukprot:m51a1_g6342 putative non-processive endoglucanase (318) ;mRNA; f:37324-38351